MRTQSAPEGPGGWLFFPVLSGGMATSADRLLCTLGDGLTSVLDSTERSAASLQTPDTTFLCNAHARPGPFRR